MSQQPQSNESGRARGLVIAALITTFGGILVAIITYVLGPLISHPPPSSTPTPILVYPSPQQTSTSPPKWKVIVRYYNRGDFVNNGVRYVPPSRTHYLIIEATLENDSPQQLAVTQQMYELKDSQENVYSEDQASSPGQSHEVDPGKSLILYIAYVVPDSQCTFKFFFIEDSQHITLWTISYNDNWCSKQTS
jgi:hypothetical protein